MKNTNLILAVLLSVVLGFAGGYLFQDYRQTKNRSQIFGQLRAGSNQPFRNRLEARQAIGEIINQDDKSITVKMMDGSSKIILLSDSTNINKAAAGSREDLKVGEKVAIFGSDNTDGSLTAQNIQLNPIPRGQRTP